MDLPLRVTVRGVSLASLLAVTALGSPAQARVPSDISIPRPTGAHAVGTRAIELVDRSRPMGFGLEGPRRLMVQLTYPIARHSKCSPAPYAPKGILQRLQQAFAFPEPVGVDSGICAGGKIKGGARPLVIFSHGFALDRFLYAALTSDLASRGFIVASVDHTGEAFSVRFPHAEYVDGAFGGPVAPPLTREEGQAQVEIRAADLSFVLSKLRKLGRDSKGVLAGHVGSHAGVFGHSLGGATANQVAIVDGRFDAAADLEGPVNGGPATATGATIPYLLALAGDGPLWARFRLFPLCDFYSASTGRKDAWVLSDALHNSYSDFQVLAPEIARQQPAWPLASSYQTVVGTIDPTASIDSQRRALGAFFSAHLKHGGKPGALSPPGSFVEAPADGLVCA